uniref:Uncharacterized protein n=1 Tax=Pseudo-nitzschia delicatissima TaxID=44447 RepID=A0A7S0TD29_9STRA|mmetsp:Transcript_14/g.38  ORF Transcript_14/g.38 Transcript_14/m.38 type:complete len:642 (+) Transcript_14:192-2117(+)
MMLLLRFLAAATCLCSIATAETLKLRRSIDPDLIVEDDLTAAAIADAEDRYQTLKEDYIKEGCLETWGEFPTAATPRNNQHPLLENNKNKGGMICNCGMLYDLALSAVFREEDNQAETIAGAAIEGFVGVEFARDIKPTQIQSWVMARTANAATRCSGGFAAGYPCKNVDLIAHKPLNDFVATTSNRNPRGANDVWGWTSIGGREFIIWGVREGMFFFEVFSTNNSNPLVLLGFLPATSGAGWQHDMKVIGEYAYIGAEGQGHGMQIFDMRRLLNVNPNSDCVSSMYCQKLSPDRVYRGSSIYEPIGNSHNIVANEDSKYIYVVGSQSCNGGLHVVDVWNPLNPIMVACYGKGGYVHDAQCVNYKGPDSRYQNKEICFCFNEDTVDIIDVSDKENIRQISSKSYGNVEYTHQGWLSSDHTHIVFGDEGDEARGLVSRTRTLVMNVQNLENPNGARAFNGATSAVDHNQYVINARAKGQNYASNNDLIYQANYEAGLRILQVIDYNTANFKEIGYFDTYPFENAPAFEGAWSVYPYFKSGLVVISSINEGLFVVKPRLEDDLGLANTDTQCSDKPLAYKFKGKTKNCDWVGKKRQGRKTRLRIKKRCRRIHPDGGGALWNWCQETCGEVGIGQCDHLDTKIK